MQNPFFLSELPNNTKAAITCHLKQPNLTLASNFIQNVYKNNVSGQMLYAPYFIPSKNEVMKNLVACGYGQDLLQPLTKIEVFDQNLGVL